MPSGHGTIISLVFGLPITDSVVARLLRNPVDFERALQPFYGDRIAAAFRDLLREHLVLAADLVKAVKAGNNEAAAEAERKWYANADAIAVFPGKDQSFLVAGAMENNDAPPPGFGKSTGS
jgi:hypothetical protein